MLNKELLLPATSKKSLVVLSMHITSSAFPPATIHILDDAEIEVDKLSLDPYFDGEYSETFLFSGKTTVYSVLIDKPLTFDYGSFNEPNDGGKTVDLLVIDDHHFDIYFYDPGATSEGLLVAIIE